MQLVNDQVGGWCSRVGRKLADQLDDHSLINKDASLLQQFRNISTMVHQHLLLLIENQPEAGSDDEESLNIEGGDARDLNNEFGSHEFMARNFRVRPVSSQSRAGDRDASEAAHRAGEEEDNERNFNENMGIEVSIWRREQKKRYAELQAARAAALEAEEKKKKSKQ